MLDDHLVKEQALFDKKILFYLVALVNPWFWSKIGNYPFVFGQNPLEIMLDDHWGRKQAT